jgi:RNA methyltransferase, TrmH family
MFSKSHTKYIQSLHHKKFRDEFGLFIAEGPKLVEEFLRAPNLVCKELFALPQWLNANEQLVASKNATAIFEVKDFELEKISALATPNQVLAVFEKLFIDESPNISGKITLALDTIQDPGNMGTIIRIADWFGVQNIICTEGCADMYNPKVVQSTMGSLPRVNIVYTNLAEWITRNNAIKTYAAALNGKTLKETGQLKEGIIIIGNESKGISDEILRLASQKIAIEKKGTAESLNAAVATGIILSQLT